MASSWAAEISGVLGGQQPPGALDEGQPGAEAGEHLIELAAYAAAAHHDEVPEQLGEVQLGARSVVRGGVEAVYDQAGGAHPRHQENLVGLKWRAAHGEPPRRG